MQGVAGEWEVVEQPASSGVNDEVDATPESSKKRVAEELLDPEDARSFKLRKKVAPSVTDSLEADLIPIRLKPKKTEEVKEEELSQPNEEAPVKWTTRGWKQPENEPDNTLDSTTLVDKEVEAKAVAVLEPTTAVLEPEVKEEPGAPSLKTEPLTETVGETGAVFRKRKFAGNRGKR